MRKSEKYARYFRHKQKPASRVAVYGLRGLFFFLLSKAGYFYMVLLSNHNVNKIMCNLRR